MKKQKLIEDLVTVTSGFIKSVKGAKDFSKNKLREKVSLALEELNFANKLEMDELKAMVIKSREETDNLKKKLNNIENKLKKNK
tara:strand:- start:187 stop:438 length:252 start_codon:yes stop_codon:yes gene_type:complete